jgi:hypothetical protein
LQHSGHLAHVQSSSLSDRKGGLFQFQEISLGVLKRMQQNRGQRLVLGQGFASVRIREHTQFMLSILFFPIHESHDNYLTAEGCQKRKVTYFAARRVTRIDSPLFLGKMCRNFLRVEIWQHLD